MMPQPGSFPGSLWTSLLIGLALIVVSPARSSDQEPKFLIDTNFFGNDIRDFNLPEESPRLCYQACVDEKTCHAFTYLRPYGWPGAGSTAHCWLKYAVPKDIRHEHCCVSGLVRSGEDPPPVPPPPPPRPPAPEPLPPVRTTDLKLFAASDTYKGACPAMAQFRGVITASGRGTVTYAFTQGAAIKDVHQLAFQSSGTREVRTTIQAGTPGETQDLRVTLRILNHVYCVRGPCPTWVTERSADAVTNLRCDDTPAGKPAAKGPGPP